MFKINGVETDVKDENVRITHYPLDSYGNAFNKNEVKIKTKKTIDVLNNTKEVFFDLEYCESHVPKFPYDKECIDYGCLGEYYVGDARRIDGMLCVTFIEK
jgi:hypothetical protein